MRRHHAFKEKFSTPMGIVFVFVLISIVCMLGTAPFVSKMIHAPYIFILIRIAQVAVMAVILYKIVKHSHLALKRSRQDYQELLDLGREPIVVHLRGKIVDVNDFGLALFDASCKEDLIGKPIMDFAHPSDRTRARARMAQLLSGILTDITEMKMVTLAGNVKDIELVGVPKNIQGGTAIQLMLRDITPRRQMERDLHNVVELFQILEGNMSDLITILDGEGKVKYSSPSHQRVLGRDIEVDEHNEPISFHIHQDDCRRVLQSCKRMMHQQETLREEFRIQHSDGHWLHVDMRGTPFLNADGQVEGAVLVTRDVTETKWTEDLLRRSDKLAAIGQLAAGLAHEVRNPMTVLQGFIQLMQMSEKTNDEYISLMLSEVQRIESIIKDFLVFAKPTSMEFRNADVCQLIQYTVALLETQAIMKCIEIRTHFDIESADILCNKDNVKQVFINVIKNAIEAMNDGGSLVIEVQKGNGDVTIVVIDEGEGIPEHLIQRLGEPFYTTKENGTGLGLMITHKLVENNHGQIRFASHLGKGTRVEISFPLAAHQTDSTEPHLADVLH